MTPDDALKLRKMINFNKELVRYYEAKGKRTEADNARCWLAACTKKIAEIEVAEADAKRGGDDNARFV